MKFPLQLLLDDPVALEKRCIQCITDYYVEAIARQFRPDAEPGDPLAAA